MTIKLKELKGPESWRAYQVFSTLLLGLNMIPAFDGKDFATFFEEMKEKSDEEKESYLRQALVLVNLTDDDIRVCLKFALDPNGVPYSDKNIASLGPEQMFEIMLALMVEFGKVKIYMVTEEEKKKYQTSAST